MAYRRKKGMCYGIKQDHKGDTWHINLPDIWYQRRLEGRRETCLRASSLLVRQNVMAQTSFKDHKVTAYVMFC